MILRSVLLGGLGAEGFVCSSVMACGWGWGKGHFAVIFGGPDLFRIVYFGLVYRRSKGKK